MDQVKFSRSRTLPTTQINTQEMRIECSFKHVTEMALTTESQTQKTNLRSFSDDKNVHKCALHHHKIQLLLI